MKLINLTPGEVFTIDGAQYETEYVAPSGLIVMCYVLDKNGKRVPDPEDLTGDDGLKECFSHIRVNREIESLL